MAIVAKMRAAEQRRTSVGGTDIQESVALTPVYSDDKNSENYQWSKLTPSGKLELTITNPDAQGYVEPGREYRVTIERIRGPRDAE